MTEWLEMSFIVVGGKEDVELNIAGDIFYPYLTRVIICLQKSKCAAEKPQCSAFQNCTFTWLPLKPVVLTPFIVS